MEQLSLSAPPPQHPPSVLALPTVVQSLSAVPAEAAAGNPTISVTAMSEARKFRSVIFERSLLRSPVQFRVGPIITAEVHATIQYIIASTSGQKGNSVKRLLYALFFVAPSALAGVVIENPWAAATPPGASVGGGYLVIRNTGFAPERIIGASSPASQRVEMHMSMSEGDIMKMRQQNSMTIPANGRLEFKPGGTHLMFVGLKQPFKEGGTVPLTLRFEGAGELKTELHVQGLGAHSHAH